jgi:mRNA interferase RelE/StbE
MIIRIDKSFQKDVNKINDAKIKSAIGETISNVQIAENIHSIKNLKKLTGFKNLYRIRLGDYRIGLEYTADNELIFIRFLNRKEIYQRWP